MVGVAHGLSVRIVASAARGQEGAVPAKEG